jgi:hypothetical protein
MKSRADVIQQIRPRPLRLGQSDCERIREGFIAQPVNTFSNIGYVISGAELVARGLDGQVKRPRLTTAFGLALTALGVSSAAYHGPGTTWGKWSHDTSIAGALTFIGVAEVSEARAWSRPMTVIAGCAGLLGAAALLAVRPDATNPLDAGLVALSAGVAVVQPKSSRPNIRRVAPAMIVAEAANALGRTNGPLCQPDSLLQGHAVWHMLTAAALRGWARSTIASPRPR